MNQIPQKLDWVEKRAACNVGEVFDQISTDIKADVNAINSAKRLPEDSHFVVNETSVGNTIIVGQTGVFMMRRVVVSIGIVGDEIEVRDEAQDDRVWRVRVGLNDEGRCLLRYQEGDTVTELEQWQFRKRALENLFFEKVQR